MLDVAGKQVVEKQLRIVAAEMQQAELAQIGYHALRRGSLQFPLRVAKRNDCVGIDLGAMLGKKSIPVLIHCRFP